MTQPIAADEANQLLSPHLRDISDCIDRGWKRWRALLALDTELGIIISNRSRASLVHDFIRYEAVSAFDSDPRVVVSESRGFVLLTFAEKIVIRFKKFRDGSLRTSGVPTQQSREYASQVLPGMEELTHLVAGYLPDEAGLDLDRAAITCTLDKDQLWVLELDLGIEEGALSTPIPLPATGDQPDTVVRPKPAAAEEAPAQNATEER